LDTADDARRPVEVPGDGDEAAWNAHDVWRERVREARVRPSGVRVRVSGRTLPPAAGGWDPLETWRERVLRPRHR
jgi:hypothetical protein